jgi:imidazolonepropionase-like amidohydrolase
MKTFAKNDTWLDPTASAFRFFDPKFWPSTQSAYRSLAALMRSNGVKILAGTDQSSYLESKGSMPGQSLHEEIGFFVDAGFTPAEALWTATEGPAEFLGLTDLVGGIQPGKSADLVLLEADPFKDISNTRRIAAVIKQGHLYDSAALSRLREIRP